MLDVKLRSDQVRATRARTFTFTLSAMLLTFIGLVLIWQGGKWGLNRLVYENPSFAIQNIEIQTDGEISGDQLRRWARVRIGENLFALGLADVKRDLEMVPLIRSVAVERVPPGLLRIRVAERVAVAQVNVPQSAPDGGIVVRVFQLDEAGYVMLPLDPRQRTTALFDSNSALPVLTGIKHADLQPGRQVDSPQVQAALDLVTAFSCSPMTGLVDLMRVDVASPQVLIVTTGQGSEVTFATGGFDRQLARWREIHDLGERLHRQIATLDLAVTNNIPARWMEASSETPPPPRSVPPARNRRRNV